MHLLVCVVHGACVCCACACVCCTRVYVCVMHVCVVQSLVWSAFQTDCCSEYSTSSLIVHLVVWVVDQDYYGYWTIKFQTKINKLMVQYISICDIHQLPH